MTLTGNPFVDTGLMVIAALAKCKSVDDLTFESIREVFADGRKLAEVNQSLKCFTMVFGTNGPLTQPAYKKAGKHEQIYLSILRQLLASAEGEGKSGQRCDLTGIRTTLDFHAVCAKALSEAGVAVPDQKWLGREWIPLGGSLGNDAQALPVASRPLHVSALAVFALQYLPMGVSLLKGKLSFFQSTYTDFSQLWVANIVERNQERLTLGEREILGKKEGTSGTLVALLECFSALTLLPGTEALLWQFSNSGKGADCRVDEIPEAALAFIAAGQARFGSEIRQLLKTDPKDSRQQRQQMFECIRGCRDYPGLYPFKKQLGATPEFYDYYQSELLGADTRELHVARKLAKLILENEDAKKVKEIRKPEFLRSLAGRVLVRKYIIQFLTPQEYDALFPSEYHPIRVKQADWMHLQYYLSTTRPYERPTPFIETAMTTTHPKIIQIAETYRSEEPRKVKMILDRMARREIGVRWLQDKFCLLATRNKGWNFGEWDDFACDENGKVVAFELLFQLRLYLSNLYREMIEKNKGEVT